VARVERLLEEWGMSEAGDRADERVRDQAFVALAFAQAMLDGAVDGDVSARAMAAIDRQLGDLAAWPDPAARGATLEKVKAKLAALR
jgi:hypothetical protein